jgi:hypothetical protein
MSPASFRWLNLTVNDTAGNRAQCLFNINISDRISAVVSGNQCRYKQYGFWNDALPYMRERGCF